jgi:hypothetical protein
MKNSPAGAFKLNNFLMVSSDRKYGGGAYTHCVVDVFSIYRSQRILSRMAESHVKWPLNARGSVKVVGEEGCEEGCIELSEDFNRVSVQSFWMMSISSAPK